MNASDLCEVLAFFNRHELLKLSVVNRQFHGLIQKYFPAAPYLVIQNLHIKIINSEMQLKIGSCMFIQRRKPPRFIRESGEFGKVFPFLQSRYIRVLSTQLSVRGTCDMDSGKMDLAFTTNLIDQLNSLNRLWRDEKLRINFYRLSHPRIEYGKQLTNGMFQNLLPFAIDWCNPIHNRAIHFPQRLLYVAEVWGEARHSQMNADKRIDLRNAQLAGCLDNCLLLRLTSRKLVLEFAHFISSVNTHAVMCGRTMCLDLSSYFRMDQENCEMISVGMVLGYIKQQFFVADSPNAYKIVMLIRKQEIIQPFNLVNSTTKNSLQLTHTFSGNSLDVFALECKPL